MIGGVDLRTLPAQRLVASAEDLYLRGQYSGAVAYLYHAVLAGADGAYNLACYYALAGQSDAAFYWLERSALEQGVDVLWADEDPDLEVLRRHPRWPRARSHLASGNAYWANQPGGAAVVVAPRDYVASTPIGVLVGMHGLGSCAAAFVQVERFQSLADELHMAIVGIDGPLRTGKCTFSWSEDPARDADHIRRQLAGIADRVTTAPGELIVFGFSQGAQMAFEVAFSNPGEYRGAIVLSPGTLKDATLRELRPQPGNAKQAFVCTSGAEEHSGNVAAMLGDCNFARNGRAKIEIKLYEGVASHDLPGDFIESFPHWVRFIVAESGSGSHEGTRG
jgi:predicted esterase